jgi:seryl-tRNA(Sec) selenium transferase
MASWGLITRMEVGTAVGAMLGVGVVVEDVVSVAVEEDGTMDLKVIHNKMEAVEEDGTMDLKVIHNKMEEAVEEDGTMDLKVIHNKMEEAVEEDGTMDLKVIHNKMGAVEGDGTMDLRLIHNKMEDTIVNHLFKAAVFTLLFCLYSGYNLRQLAVGLFSQCPF